MPFARPELMASLPIRARIALFGAAVVLLTVVLFGALVDVLFERSLYSQQDQLLLQRSQQIAQPASGRDGRPGFGLGFNPQRPQLPVDIRATGDTFVEFVDRTGTPIYSTGELDGGFPRIDPNLLAQAGAGGQATTIDESGLKLRVSVRPVAPGQILSTVPGQELAYVVVGQSATATVAQVNLLRLYLLVAALLSLFGALLASWVVAGRALRPLDRMTETVEAIGSASDLRRRLPEAPARDEVGRLTGAFNAMMGRLDDAYGRLEGALESQRRFVADASHELRTPLTSIRSNLGLLRGRNDISAADRAEALHDMDAEAQRMSRLVADLLTLARADAGQQLELTAIDLSRLCEEVCRQARRTYPGRRVDLSRKPLPRVAGNADSLRQLLWILLDNAARHTDDGGRITVALETGAQRVRLAVGDDGVGIAADDRDRVFERFYRADHARSSGGAGLGLSIARWIVAQHGGQIGVEDNAGGRGTVFTVALPLPRAASAGASAGASEIREVA